MRLGKPDDAFLWSSWPFKCQCYSKWLPTYLEICRDFEGWYKILPYTDASVFEPREGKPFRVAEFGANEGGTSIHIMTEIIGKYLKRQTFKDLLLWAVRPGSFLWEWIFTAHITRII